MADKLSNMRSIARDHAEYGDGLWERFNAPKERQAWYYDGIADALYDMQDVPQCENLYWEFTALFKDVFVKYFLDQEESTIYQVCETGKVYGLQKGNDSWNEVCGQKCVPETAVPLTRQCAEFTEDVWNTYSWDHLVCRYEDRHKAKIRAAVRNFCKNDFWNEYYQKAPSNICKRYIALEFYCSDKKGKVADCEEFDHACSVLEKHFSVSDWKHLHDYCGNSRRKMYYQSKMELMTE